MIKLIIFVFCGVLLYQCSQDAAYWQRRIENADRNLDFIINEKTAQLEEILEPEKPLDHRVLIPVVYSGSERIALGWARGEDMCYDIVNAWAARKKIESFRYDCCVSFDGLRCKSGLN